MGAVAERRLFTRQEYHAMARAGILTEDDPVELLDGEIIRKMPSGPAHAGLIKRLNRVLSALVKETAIVSVQDPLALDEYSEPEPDVMLLRPRPDFYYESHPMSQDVWLVIEVADTSLTADKEVNVPLYASHEVPEVWLVDLEQRQVVAYSALADGRYSRERIYRSGEVIPLTALPGKQLHVAELGL